MRAHQPEETAEAKVGNKECECSARVEQGDRRRSNEKYQENPLGVRKETQQEG